MLHSGQRIARLSRTQTICKASLHSRTWLIKLISWFMFFAPSSRLTILEGIWIDESINEVQWNKFISKQQEDWQTYVNMVSVLQMLHSMERAERFAPGNRASYVSVALNMRSMVLISSPVAVNTALLAIPSVDSGPNAGKFRSGCQILAYISTITSCNAVVAGLLLIQ
jgi:hypothetical protein